MELLNSYHSQRPEDETVPILEAFLKNLKGKGLENLIHDLE